MPSPFPGMNPYLEQDDAWHDFHESFIPLAREWLSAQVDPHFFVKIDEQMYIHELSANERRFLGRGDVFLTRPPEMQDGGGGTALLAAPAEIQLAAVGFVEQSFLEIRDRHNRQIVTVIELLSPSNKYAGSDRDQYLAKRARVLRSRAHFVEIDLLRGGPRMPVEGEMPACDYCVLVSRAVLRPRAGLWPIMLRDPLPTIPIPLRPPHADATLDLQALLHRLYDAARYGGYIYENDPQPALPAEDAAWARQFLPRPADVGGG